MWREKWSVVSCQWLVVGGWWLVVRVERGREPSTPTASNVPARGVALAAKLVGQVRQALRRQTWAAAR